MQRVVRVVCAVLLMMLAPGAAAAQADDLYRARTIVTGQSEASRADGFARCFADVLVKVSGDPRLAADPRVAALAGKAGDYVEAFSYRDRMAGIPVHDEQGSRDRPYFLTVEFDPERIDALLVALDRKPWAAPRPVLRLELDVTIGGREFILTSDGAEGRDMRDALAEAAERFGIVVNLPGGADIVGDQLLLEGTLTWSPEALGWTAEWHLETGGMSYRWNIRGVSFDAAFRDAISGAARILSGNGAPG